VPTITLAEDTARFLLDLLRGEADFAQHGEAVRIANALEDSLSAEDEPGVPPDVSFGSAGVLTVESRMSDRGGDIIIDGRMIPRLFNLRPLDGVALRLNGDDEPVLHIVREVRHIQDVLSPRDEVRLVLVPAEPFFTEQREVAPFTAVPLTGFTLTPQEKPQEKTLPPTLWDRILEEGF
jgi:hypothetical protein